MAVGLILSVVLAELVARAYEHWLGFQFELDQIAMTRDAPWGWSYEPNIKLVRQSPEFGRYELTTNSFGLLDREYAQQKQEGVFRILLLGDSFGADERVPTEYAYHEIAEQLLRESQDVPIEVLNASVVGWSTDQELVYYEEFAHKFDPDLVILAFCMCNDVMGNYEGWSYRDKPTFGLRRGKLVQVKFPTGQYRPGMASVVGDFELTSLDSEKRLPFALQVRKWASENLRLFAYLRAAGNSMPAINRILIGAGLREDIRFIHRIFMVDESPEMQEAWIVTEMLVGRLAHEVVEHGSEFAVLVIHSPFQLETAYWWEPEFDYYPAMKESVWDLRRPDSILQEALEQEAIPYYFLIDPFSFYIEATGNLTTWQDDQHWNRMGHRLAGRLMAEWLLSSGLLTK